MAFLTALGTAAAVPMAAGTAAAGAAASGAATVSMAPSILSGLTLGKALLYGGSLLQGLGTIGESQAQASAMEAQANAAMYNAKQQAFAAKEAGFKLSRERRRTLGTQAAVSGASGVELTGSPLDVMAQTAAEYERDIQMYGYTAESALRTGGYESQMLKGLAKQRRMGGFIGAAGSVLTGTYGRSLLGGY